ncbi:MAG: S8 family peptidase [Agathobacter sp.]|nr:S8 family peptidase [Agathobacter sp.]
MINDYGSKMETNLYASLSATPSELQSSPDLAVGFTAETDTWEVIIQYVQSPEEILKAFPSIAFTPLLGNYAIVRVPAREIDNLALFPAVVYMEKPRQLFYEVLNGKREACIGGLVNNLNLSGKNTIVGIIDSGIDYFHPDFRNNDGTTRILYLWDQTLDMVFDSAEINAALAAPTRQTALALCPSEDYSGHGTHVAGIAAGNGNASMGQYRGIAYEADLIIVKLSTGSNGFSTTARLLEALDFCVRKSIEQGLPLALNISYGNTYGSHSGTSILEKYIDYISSIYKISIAVGSGNEASYGGHASGKLSNNADTVTNQLSISNYTTNLSLQIWKNPWENIAFSMQLPNNERLSIPSSPGVYRFSIDNNQIYITVGDSTPFSIYQEIYVDLTGSPYLQSGIWSVIARGEQIIDGNYDMWLPSYAIRNEDTRFLTPDVNTTLTIPSTSGRVITVGAYDSIADRPVAFSGRGPTWNTEMIKPDLVAPGVNIISCAPGGGYTSKSGTSMATPFVTGSCSLLMQWGIADGNDAFFYGDKIKAALIRGSKKLPFIDAYPNPITGWGALCLRNSIPN